MLFLKHTQLSADEQLFRGVSEGVFARFFWVSHKMRATNRMREGEKKKEGLPGWKKERQMERERERERVKDVGFPEPQEMWEFRSLQLPDTQQQTHTERSVSCVRGGSREGDDADCYDDNQMPE